MNIKSIHALLILGLSTLSIAQDDAQMSEYERVTHPPNDGTQDIIEVAQAAGIGIGGEWQRIDINFPPPPAGSNRDSGSSAPTHYFNFYNPAGAIAFTDLSRAGNPEDSGPYSASQVAWFTYRRAVELSTGAQPGQGQYDNIRYIIHLDVTSDDFVADFGQMVEVEWFEPDTDGYRAFDGSISGSVSRQVVGDFQQQNGGRSIRRIGIYIRETGRFDLIWELN